MSYGIYIVHLRTEFYFLLPTCIPKHTHIPPPLSRNSHIFSKKMYSVSRLAKPPPLRSVTSFMDDPIQKIFPATRSLEKEELKNLTFRNGSQKLVKQDMIYCLPTS